MIYKRYISLTRRKVSFFVIPLLVVSLIFILYQVSIFMQLSNDYKNKNQKFTLQLVRGTHEQQASFYEPNAGKRFICIRSLEEIDFKKVNDDYCDCLDGSDEPGTNACDNGIFYCRNQKRFPKSIHSSMVNDGICDCCDGSDEWKNIDVLQNLKTAQQTKLKKYHPPCPNIC